MAEPTFLRPGSKVQVVFKIYSILLRFDFKKPAIAQAEEAVVQPVTRPVSDAGSAA